uniref:Uncharacterized protein n=1 Tax=Apteryx owenii TaxID=8824 RepID=A0A8B9PWR2_APTOW
MASLYQRFSGKINTSRSFPVPPEASHLLGAQCNEEDSAAAKTPRPLQQENSRPRFQYQPRSDCEEEDVSASCPRCLTPRSPGGPRPAPRAAGCGFLTLAAARSRRREGISLLPPRWLPGAGRRQQTGSPRTSRYGHKIPKGKAKCEAGTKQGRGGGGW